MPIQLLVRIILTAVSQTQILACTFCCRYAPFYRKHRNLALADCTAGTSLWLRTRLVSAAMTRKRGVSVTVFTQTRPATCGWDLCLHCGCATPCAQTTLQTARASSIGRDRLRSLYHNNCRMRVGLDPCTQPQLTCARTSLLTNRVRLRESCDHEHGSLPHSLVPGELWPS